MIPKFIFYSTAHRNMDTEDEAGYLQIQEVIIMWEKKQMSGERGIGLFQAALRKEKFLCSSKGS